MNFPYALYLDDVRWPKSNDPIHDANLVIKIARSFPAAVDIVRQLGFPEYVAFDNDLGYKSKEGWEFADFLINELLVTEKKFPRNFAYNVHSANPVASSLITSKMEQALAKIGRYPKLPDE